MATQAQKQTGGNKKTGWNRQTLVAVGLGVLLLGGGYWLWQDITNPPRPWLVRWRINNYLKKQSGVSNFKTDFGFPSRSEMADPGPPPSTNQTGQVFKGPRTGKDFDYLKREYIRQKTALLVLEREIAQSEATLKFRQPELEAMTRQLADDPGSITNLSAFQTNLFRLSNAVAAAEKKLSQKAALPAMEKEMEPIISDLWAFQRHWGEEQKKIDEQVTSKVAKARAAFAEEMRKKMSEASTYSAMYRLVGQQLWVAGELLAAANPTIRRAGLTIAFQAAQYASNEAQNYWLAARICEGYIWPNLDVANDANRRSAYSLDTVLGQCSNYFRQAEEYDNNVRNWEWLLKRADSPQRLDWAHSQVAFAQEQAGDFAGAVKNLKSIRATNDYGWAMRRLPRLEQQAQFRK